MTGSRRIVSIIGARPQFIKAAVVIRALRQNGITETLINTGQHYDDEMSEIFIRELGIPEPKYNLGVGSGLHGEQTARSLQGIEKILAEITPDLVLVYGDTNATLAGALAAAKLNIPVGHIEAGLRSFNRKMPEEINRIVADHLSTVRFCPGQTAVDNLEKEGLKDNNIIVGDVMIDMVHAFLPVSRKQSQLLDREHLAKGNYVLMTLHRPSNTDDPAVLKTALEAINASGFPVLFPVHPRTVKTLASLEMKDYPHIKPVKPLGYLDMLSALDNARILVTDSGGMQKEAHALKVPCLTFRQETEWVETISDGWNTLVFDNPEKIADLIENYPQPETWGPHYGDGHAAKIICDFLLNTLDGGLK